jgi:hypothetical protein
MSVKLDVKAVCLKAREVKAAGGNLDDVMRHFFPGIEGDAAIKSAKQQLSQIMTTTRTAIKAELIKRGMTEETATEKATVAVPTFRDGRSTSRGKAVNDLLADLLGEFEDETADETETVEA